MFKHLRRFIDDKLGDYLDGGLPFNILVDLENPEGTRHFLTVVGREFVIDTITREGEKTSWGKGEIPPTLNKYKPSTEATQYGMFLVPEYRTIVILTTDFYTKLSNASIGYVPKGTTPLTLRDWVKFVLRLNATSLLQKTNTFQQHYLKTGKIKGLSRVEIEQVKDTLIPVFINPDVGLIFPNPTSVESFIDNRITQAVSLLIHLLAHELKGELRGDNRVYYGGYRCHKMNNESATIYAPKAILMEREINTPLGLLKYMLDLIDKIDDEALEEASKQSVHIASMLSREEEDVEDDVN